MTEKQSIIEIALFPIPNLVSFPKATVPLHVFEPRYRKMIRECIERGMKIGVSHIEKKIHQGPLDQEPEEVLKTNQSTYRPQKVFSAGLCEIREVTSDERLLVDIKMDDRYELQDPVQQLPYQIYNCKLYSDELTEDVPQDLKDRLRIDEHLAKLAIQTGNKELNDLLESTEWKSLSTTDYSYTLFQIVGFDPDICQEVLEMKSPVSRIRFAHQLLNL